MSGCRHGGRDVYERPKYLEVFDAEERGGNVYYKPKRPRDQIYTTIDISHYYEDVDTSMLRTITCKGARFVREL